MEVYLIRHTQTLIDKGLCVGQTDIPLTDFFEQEADNIIANLPAQFDVIYSSPLSRCKRLAELLKGNKVLFEPRLMEMNFGDWEMKKWTEIDQDHLNTWMADFVNVRTSNGENFTDLHHRTTEFLEELSTENHEKVAIVTHAGVIRSILVSITEMNLKNAFKLSVDFGSVSKININTEHCFRNIEYLNRVF